MSLLTVGIAFSAYAGARILEALRVRRHRVRIRALRASNLPRSVPAREDNERFETHYVKSGGLALALALVRPLVPAFGVLCVALTIYGTLPLMRRAEHSLSRGRIRNDLLSSVVCLASLGLGQTLAAALEVTTFHFAYLAAARSRRVSGRALSGALPAPDLVRVRRGTTRMELRPAELRNQDLVLVNSGDMIPVDGRVVDGEIAVDQHKLTGEALPTARSPGDDVFAGTLVTEGRAEVAITETGSRTAIARLNRLLSRSVDYTSRLQLLGEQRADQIAAPLLVAGTVALPFVGASAATGILFSAPANAIGAAGSLTTSSHLVAITRGGALIKDGRALEALSGVDTFLFDKTGTLTSADLAVTAVVPLGSWSQDTVLARAAGAEAGLSHPLARALVAAAAVRLGSVTGAEREQSRFRVGYGVAATVSGERVFVGSRRLMAEAGVALDTITRDVLETAEAKGASAILIADGRQVQGVIEIQPRLRPEVGAVMAALRRGGVDEIHVVSGDSEGPTRLIAESLGLDRYFHSVLPQEKAELVRQLQSAGRRVCFVGDGVNDALAMKQAHCSISLHGASAIASDTAQVLLLDPNLEKLPMLLAAAETQQTHLKQVLTYWAGYAAVNTYLNVFLRVGVLPSTLFYAGAFALSYVHASLPKLRRPQGSVAPTRREKSKPEVMRRDGHPPARPPARRSRASGARPPTPGLSFPDRSTPRSARKSD